jgi:hypothetical protein
MRSTVASSLQIMSAKRDVAVLQFKYVNDERMKYFKKKIDENTGPEDNKTNVTGKMTDYGFFLWDPDFINFVNEEFFIPEINKYQQAFPSPNLLGKMNMGQAWGSKLEKGNEVIPHSHIPWEWSTILYFCNSAPLETEVGTIDTFKGKVVTIPGWLRHWVSPVKCEGRYNLVWNWNYTIKHSKEGVENG